MATNGMDYQLFLLLLSATVDHRRNLKFLVVSWNRFLTVSPQTSKLPLDLVHDLCF